MFLLITYAQPYFSTDHETTTPPHHDHALVVTLDLERNLCNCLFFYLNLNETYFVTMKCTIRLIKLLNLKIKEHRQRGCWSKPSPPLWDFIRPIFLIVGHIIRKIIWGVSQKLSVAIAEFLLLKWAFFLFSLCIG